jgi:hypothetical protein
MKGLSIYTYDHFNALVSKTLDNQTYERHEKLSKDHRGFPAVTRAVPDGVTKP